jgi:dTDP-4-dehydrorhamnose reductase
MIKKIYFFWYQGINDAPYIVKKCLESWYKYNSDDWEIIMLCYHANTLPSKLYTLNQNDYWSTAAYIINKKSAIKLISDIYKNNLYYLENNIKHAADDYLFIKLKTYVYKYPLFMYPYDNDSTIHPEHQNHHNRSKKIVDQIAEGRKVLKIVDDKLGTPTYTFDFAANLWSLIDKNYTGLFNMVSSGFTSRLEVAQAIVKELDVSIDIQTVTSQEFPEYFAPRPDCERLLNRRLDLHGMNQMRHWRECLTDYLKNRYF